MNLIYLLPLVLAALLALYWVLRRSAAPADRTKQADRLDTLGAWPPRGTRLLTTQERVAYNTLTRALPDHIVLAQVPLARFLKVPTRNSYTEWRRRLGNQCADLIVCDATSQVVAVVDVQASAGQASERAKKRLTRMARALKAADIPLHVWTENALPSVEAAREAILAEPAALPEPLPGRMLSKTTAPAAASIPAPAAAQPRSPFDDTARDSSQDELIEMREPPSSTWYNEFDSGPAPLPSPKPKDKVT
jgi:hypothetical protein